MTELEPKKNTFKWYYVNDPKFRKRHLQYVSEKVECLCGKMVARSHMSRHKKTAQHKKLSNEKDEVAKLKKEIKKLKKKLSKNGL
ncbi:MAG TPA: hypothetical protein PLS50_05010 [Candidatus Dojkabacteria bacterium]|nr:hypothetical protein [Candidatus Dojkabacteria bacterium]